jgi:ketopantoate reductase
MKILIVGAGAVGKVYGRHLEMGGAEVTFFIREKYLAQAKNGFPFYVLNDRAHRKSPVVWKNYRLMTELSEVRAQKWDYVIFAMSSTALHSGWVDDFLPEIQDSIVVTLQPGLFDREYLLKRIPKLRLIDGTIHIISYEAPLPTESILPGTAYWTPPRSKASFSGGSPETLQALLEVFKKGNFAVGKVDDARKLNIEAAPILNLILVALERSNWKFSELKHSKWLPMVCRAMPEAIRIQAKKSGVKAPNLGWLLGPVFVKTLMKIAQFMMPFDIEAYLEVHFIKVQDQRYEYVRDLMDYGRSQKLPTLNLELLSST